MSSSRLFIPMGRIPGPAVSGISRRKWFPPSLHRDFTAWKGPCRPLWSSHGTPMISAADILSARILVVDDDPDALRSLEQMLTSAGYTGATVTSDPRAVAGLHRERDFDAILLDVQMPHMDGFEVMEALKPFERGGYLPVLALTAEPGHRTQALRYGAKDFLRKPFDPEELLLRVRNLLEVRLLYKDCATAAATSAAH